MPINGSEPVKAAIEPENASINSLIWTSADPDTAVALPSGRVRGVKPGQTTVTAHPAGGGKISASCDVTVLPVANIAPEAKVTAIGQVGGWRAKNVIDGDLKSQWLAHGEVKPGMENPLWIKLEWPEAPKVHKNVIHAGGNTGEIAFSDGSKINLIERGMRPKDKNELVLDSPKTTISITYRLLDAIHPHAKSVNQIEVYERVA